MSNFFKSKKKPKVDQVDLFNGDVGDHCTDMSIWLFSLPMELAVEMKEKYHIPKYRWVTDNQWLMDNDDMDSITAQEWIDYNVVRSVSYMGDKKPIIVYPLYE